MKLRETSPTKRTPWLGTVVLSAALVAATALHAPAQAGSINLITDGTFQDTQNGLASPGGFLCQNGSTVGSTCTSNLQYWTPTCSSSSCEGTSTPASLLFINPTTHDAYSTAWNGGNGLYPTIAAPPGGSNVVAIDGGMPYNSTIAQTVNGLVAGNEYVLTFYQGAAQQEGNNTATTEKWQVTLGSSTQTGYTMNNAAQGVVPWNEVTMNFIATSTSEVLTFVAIGTPNGDPPVVLLADVDLFLPEPGSMALLGAGVFALLVARRRASA
jgi:hypothetical protein